jgi:toxin ParE1/3/4
LRRLEVSIAAEIDLADIFDRSAEAFGMRARRRYERLVDAALDDLLANPVRLGSVHRPELGADLHTYHLRHSRARLKASGPAVGVPRHLFAYEFDETRLLILRVLHDAMDPLRHLT